MKDYNQETVAKALFGIMNEGRIWSLGIEEAWAYYKEQGWHKGYLRIADEVIKKGYKP